MRFEMIDRDKRLAGGPGQALGHHRADDQPADQPGTGGRRDPVEPVEADLRLPPAPAAPGLRDGQDAPAPRSRARRRHTGRARRSGNGSDLPGSPDAARRRPLRPRFRRSLSRCPGPLNCQAWMADSGPFHNPQERHAADHRRRSTHYRHAGYCAVRPLRPRSRSSRAPQSGLRRRGGPVGDRARGSDAYDSAAPLSAERRSQPNLCCPAPRRALIECDTGPSEAAMRQPPEAAEMTGSDRNTVGGPGHDHGAVS